MTVVDHSTLAAIAVMALVTYGCRAAGVVLSRRLTLSPVMETVLGFLPGTLFVSYVVPMVVRGGPVQWAGAAITVAVMASTRSLAAAMAAGVAVAWLVWAIS